jgi:phenylalanyl-tRNA synthetase beta chain
MLVPLSWLKRYVNIDISPEDLAHRLTMAGVEVESIEKMGMHLDPELVVVGLVTNIEPHPDADRLRLPTVDLGNGETAKVVCGAPNVAVGQKIAFAKLGARLYNAHSEREEPLRTAKIRGFESSGMVCSVKELMLGDDHEGILVLDQDSEIGSPLTNIVGDVLFDIAVTPNRPDCLSVLGIAREVAALTGQPITEPETGYADDGEPIAGRVTVQIADPDLCRRYTASLIEGVTVGPSPSWLQETLIRAGQRPINNVVDATNFVMLEMNQPLHAFDLDLVKDQAIVVRMARPGEVLETLDGQRRELAPPMLVIADATDAVGLAGVMGGANSEVSQGTTRVLLESANFDPVNTRRTGADLKLSTGASYRFERGLRQELAEIGLRRATRLIAEIAGGTVASGIIDVHPEPAAASVVTLTAARLKQVLGTDIPMPKVKQVLASLGFERTGSDSADSVSISSPYWRSDIEIQDDLVEEVARVIGYDEMPTTMLAAPIPHHHVQPMWDLKERVRDMLAAAGMQEAINYNVASEENLRTVGAWTDDVLALANPMNDEQPYLRTTLRASLLQTVSDNRRTGGGDGLRLFELGRVFMPQSPGPNPSGGDAKLPDERETLIAAFTGRRGATSWQASDNAADMGFFDAKGVAEDLLGGLGIDVSFEPVADVALKAGRTAAILASGKRLGTVGEVADGVLDQFDLDGATVALLEIDVPSLLAAAPSGDRRYLPFSRYPESVRDLALTVDQAVSADEIRAVLIKHKLVKAARAQDVYTGDGVPQGKKSIAFGLVFQSEKATLTADQIDRVLEDLLRRLQRSVGAEIRS